jgi:hypothetical protein
MSRRGKQLVAERNNVSVTKKYIGGSEDIKAKASSGIEITAQRKNSPLSVPSSQRHRHTQERNGTINHKRKRGSEKGGSDEAEDDCGVRREISNNFKCLHHVINSLSKRKQPAVVDM